MTSSQGELPLVVAPTSPVPFVTPLSPELAEQQLQTAPPMRGEEYLDGEVLQALCILLDGWVRDRIRHYGSLAAPHDENALRHEQDLVRRACRDFVRYHR